jgi:hypothetical protein
MTIRMMTRDWDVGGAECRLCRLPMLYTDHRGHVWCAECEGWNGWFDGPFWAQPGEVPLHSPNGAPTLF